MSDCPFCDKIANGGDEHGPVFPAAAVDVYRFAPLNPVTDGHMLFVPRLHVRHASDGVIATSDAVTAAIIYASRQRIVGYNLIQSNGAPATQTVPHVHVHLVPRHDGDGLTLPWSGGAQ